MGGFLGVLFDRCKSRVGVGAVNFATVAKVLWVSCFLYIELLLLVPVGDGPWIVTCAL